MDKLIIIGAGGHGKVVADAAFASKKFKDIAFLDDKYNQLNTQKKLLIWNLIGNIHEVNNSKIRDEYNSAFVAIGDAKLRIELINRLKKLGYKLPIIKHPTAWTSEFTSIGAGTILLASSNLQTGSIIGEGCILNTGCILEHDVNVADGVHICPGVSIAGNTKIGKILGLALVRRLKNKSI